MYLGILHILSSLGYHVLCLVTQSCLTLRDPVDCSPPGSSVHGDSPGKNTGVGCHTQLQLGYDRSQQQQRYLSFEQVIHRITFLMWSFYHKFLFSLKGDLVAFNTDLLVFIISRLNLFIAFFIVLYLICLADSQVLQQN